MRTLLMIASAAAMAISMPALAKGGGHGNGGHGGHGGHGGAKAAKAHGGHGGGKRMVQARRGGEGKSRAYKVAKAQRQAFHGGGKKAERRFARAERPRLVREQHRRDDRRARERLIRDDYRPVREIREARAYRDDDRRYARYDRDEDRRYAGYDCPPGLAKKHNGCLPPGQARKALRLGDRYETRRLARYTVPASYRNFYADTPDYRYRYSDEGYIYRVDSRTSLISGLVPLLGGGFAVGQPLPTGYDVYNLPSQYRETWYDTDEANYRYGDNAIYQVDPQSGIVESIVSLLAGDLNVGQALPTGYDAYNVPLDYRDRYADSDDTLYRYADGNIYQVDAKTQMIQAIVEMLT